MDFRPEKRRKTVSDLDAFERLYQVSNGYIQGCDLSRNLDLILDAAIFITSADKGIVQLYEADGLVIARQRNFDRTFLDFFHLTYADHPTSCAAALKRVERVAVRDIKRSAIFVGQASLDVLLTAGIRAVQSTPLVSSTGKVLGVVLILPTFGGHV
jgi:hypothetical protein